MSLCGSPPPPPDYSAMATMSAQSAKEQLDWAKEVYANDKPTNDHIKQQLIDTLDTNSANAKKDREDYDRTFKPLADKLAQDADSYSSAGRQTLEAGKAEAGVAQQFEGARQSAMRNLESFGVDPTSTRATAMDLGVRTAAAAAQAGAGNQAIQNTEARGQALRSEAINIGRGMPGQIAQQYATAGGAGQGAAGVMNNATMTGAQTMGTANQWANTSANIQHMGYQDAMSYYNADSQSSGLGALAGMGLGMAKSAGMFAAMADGGPVPEHMSPTRGAALDDVDAKLTAGEFVMPKKAVSWFGEKAMLTMIEKADKERAELTQRTQAVPDVQRGPVNPNPAFVSRPQGRAAALPMG